MTDDHSKIRDGIAQAVTDINAPRLVAAYFDHTNGFAADTYETLGSNPPFELGTDDLLATSLLDVAFQPAAVRAWLGTEKPTITALLKRISPNADLYSDGTDDDLHAARDLHRTLQAQRGVGWVKAGKILARKRPRLIPVYDSVVQQWMRMPEQFWEPLRGVLREDGVVDSIERLRPDGCDVATLRLLDVAIWMQGSNSKRARRMRQAGPPPNDR